MYSFIIKTINALIRGLGAVLTFIFKVLPDSPFQKHVLENEVIMPYLKMINYFVPVAEILITFESLLIAIGVYYIYQVVARWVKIIS